MKPSRCIASIAFFLIIAIPIGRAVANYVSETYLTEAYSRQLHYSNVKISGNGPKHAVLLHGLAGASNYWDGLLDPMMNSYRFASVDLIGFGDSPKPLGAYDSQMHAEAIITGLKRSGFHGVGVVVAHSMGALIAIEVARKIRVPKLVLVGLPVFDSAEAAKDSLASVSYMHKAMVEGGALIKISCFFRDTYRLPFLAKLFDLPKDVYNAGTRHTWHSLSQSLKNVIVNNRVQWPADASLQGVLIHAADDTVAPFKNAESFAFRNKLKMIKVNNGGHNFLLTNPLPLLSELDDKVVD